MGPQAQVERPPPGARHASLWVPRCPSVGDLLLYEAFYPRKNQEKTFETFRRRLEAESGQEHFCSPAERFRQGNFPPGGGN